MVLRVVAHFHPKNIQSYEKFLTFANISCNFLHFDAFFRKIVYLSVANSRALISPVTYVFKRLHLILISAREHSAPERIQPRTYIIYTISRTLTHAHVCMHAAICQHSDLSSVSAAVSRREKRSGVQLPAVFRRPFSVHFIGIVSRHRLPEPPSIYHAWSISYLALLERSVLFHALIVLDGLGGDGGGDLAGVGYLGVGSR